MAEKHIEQYLRKVVKLAGGLCYKFVSPSRRGVCDRIVISGNGFTYYIETKFGKNGLSPAQVQFAKEMAKVGVEVYVLATKQEVDEFMEKVYF